MGAPHDSVTLRQLPLIARIIRDETWLEGERRGRPVTADDPAVRENVCAVILRVGGDLRRQLTTATPGSLGSELD